MDQLSIITLFVWTAVFVVGLGLLLFLFMRSPPRDLETMERKVAPIVPVLSLLLATSVSLASAVVTISGNRLTVSVSQKQQAREEHEAMKNRASEIVYVYSDLSFSVSRLIRAGFGILVHGEYILQAPGDSDLDPTMEARIDVFLDALLKLDKSLQAVLFDQDARELIQNNRIEGALSYIGEKARVELPELAYFSDFDFVSLIHFIDGSRTALERDPVSHMRHAYCTLLLNGGGDRLDHRELGPTEWVAFTGYLIFVAWMADPLENYFVYSIGLAMLQDLIHMIPDGDAISQYVGTQAYGGEVAGIPVSFDPLSVLGNRFVQGTRGLLERREFAFFGNVPVEKKCW